MAKRRPLSFSTARSIIRIGRPSIAVLDSSGEVTAKYLSPLREMRAPAGFSGDGTEKH
jgi:hypothetical protein